MKVLKLDDKVKAINICDGGKHCRAVTEEMGDSRTQIMKIQLKKRWDFDDFENNVPSLRKRQHRVTGNVNINQLC
jgi:hypothetical protein